jgi:hypothetical protein
LGWHGCAHVIASGAVANLEGVGELEVLIRKLFP